MLTGIPHLRNENPYKANNHKHRQILISCANSFVYFCQFLGLPMAEFHKEWARMFFNNPDSIIAAPRGHAKTTWTILIITWIMLFPNKWKKHFDVLASQHLDIVYVTSVRRPVALNFHENFSALFEITLDKLQIRSQVHIKMNNTEKIILGNKTRMNILTLMGGIRSVRAHFNINDDLQKDKGQIISEVIRIYEGSVTPIMHEGGHAVILGTVKADHDIIMNYHHKPEYPSKIYKAINVRELPDGTEEEYALWPERLSLKELRHRKMKLTPATFSREYQNDPANDDFALIKKAMIDHCQDWDMHLFELEPEGATYVSVDLARSAHKDADYTVATLFQVLKDYKNAKKPTLVIKDQWVFHASEIGNYVDENSEDYEHFFYNPLLKQLIKWQNDYNVRKVFVEENQFQQTIVFMIKDKRLVGETRIEAEGITMGRQKQHDVEGIPKIRTMLMSRRLIFPYGDPASRTIMDRLTDELQKWIDDPVSGKFVCTARHDDQTMSLYVGLLGILPLIDRFNGVSSVASPNAKNAINTAISKEMDEIMTVMETKGFDNTKQIAVGAPQIPVSGSKRRITL